MYSDLYSDREFDLSLILGQGFKKLFSRTKKVYVVVKRGTVYIYDSEKDTKQKLTLHINGKAGILYALHIDLGTYMYVKFAYIIVFCLSLRQSESMLFS